MRLSIGIVGLPNVGKSTLFRLLTRQEVNVANYPFATINPNIGIVAVPDERLGKLAALSKSKQVIPAVVEFYDIAGLVKGAHEGEGLGNQFLSHIREVSVIVHVLRCFSLTHIVHVENRVDPLADLLTVHNELALKDLETVRKVIDRVEAEARSGKKEAISSLSVLYRVKSLLEEGKQIVEYANNPSIAPLNLLMAKKQLYLLNGKEEDVPFELKARIQELGGEYIVANLKTRENSSLEDKTLSELIRRTYSLLGLISFFTTGEKETRAWTIRRGALAPEAAGEIHSDFEKKFIRAEVISWDKLLIAGSFAAAKAKGWIRIEGKDYEVQDGDVMLVRHG